MADSGTGNTAVGVQSLSDNSSGEQNSAFGFNALAAITAGDANIAIGMNAGAVLVSGSNNIYLGNIGNTDETGTIRIGSPSQVKTFVAGISGTNVTGGTEVFVDSSGQLGTVLSSRRFKEDIRDMGAASDGLMRLRPVTFLYKTDYDREPVRPVQFGLIAEEVAQVYPELVQHSADGRPLTVYYHLLTPMLLNEVQKQHRELEAQQLLIDQLTARLDRLEKQSQATTVAAQVRPAR